RLRAVRRRREGYRPGATPNDEEKVTPVGGSQSTSRRDPLAEQESQLKTPLTIHLEGFEGRAIQLPAAKGRLWNLAVTQGDKLIYGHDQPAGQPSIRLLDPFDSKKEAS